MSKDDAQATTNASRPARTARTAAPSRPPEKCPDNASKSPPRITADMTLLDVVGRYRSTEKIFRSRDAQAGQCLLCTALFLTLDEAAQQHGLNLPRLLRDLETAARRET